MVYANKKMAFGEELEWVRDSIQEYLKYAWSDLQKENLKPKNKRQKHLIGLPVIGTGCKKI